MADQSNEVDLDSFDLQILDILQRNNTISLRAIGDKISLSGPAVQRRVMRLEHEGIIKANVAVIDQQRVDRPITVIVEVQMETERKDILEDVKASLSLAEEVQQCYYTTGDADFILVITVTDMQEYEALTHKLFFDNPHIKRFRTFVAMQNVKVGLHIPIPGESIQGRRSSR